MNSHKHILDFEYEGKNWSLFYDKSILPSKHCEKCDFKHLCQKYIDDNEWFACGCTFNADSYYIKVKCN